jgi:hypothetical protein
VLGELVVVVHSLVRLETSTGSIFAFATVLECGVTAGALGMAIASVLADAAHRKPVRIIVANAASWALALAAAGGVLAIVTGGRPGELGLDDLPAIATAAVAMFAVNFTLIMTVVGVEEGTPVVAFARDELWSAASEDVAGSSVATIIGLAGVRAATAPPLLLPFILVAGGPAGGRKQRARDVRWAHRPTEPRVVR